MTDPKLEPCPFCGGEAYKYEAEVFDTPLFLTSITCDSCCASVESDGRYKQSDATAEAIAAWNHRATPQPEGLAVIIFEAMRWAAQHAESGNPPEWKGGNSIAEDKARETANRILAALKGDAS